MFTIFCTQVLGLGVNILVNVAVYPAILSCFSSKIVEMMLKTSPINRWINDTMVIILKSTKDYFNVPQKLQGICIQSLGRNNVCNRQGCSMPQPRIVQFSIKMCASQPDGQRAWMLTIFCAQVLGLGMNILVKCCSISCNSVVL